MKSNSTFQVQLSITILLMIAISFSFAFASEKPDIQEYPYPGYSNLGLKAEWLQKDLRQNNLQYGLVMPRVLLPPEGNADHSTAHQEDGGNRQ